MSQYDITRTCGHVETVNITGTNVRGERDRRATREATYACRACWQDARIAATADSELTGSPKQIAWATDIRNAVAAQIQIMQQQMDTGVAAHPDKAEQATAVMDAVRAEYARHTDARWWIDNRTDAFTTIRSAAATALAAR